MSRSTFHPVGNRLTRVSTGAAKTVEQKRCSRCEETLRLDDFGFVTRGEKKNRRNICKLCANDSRAAEREWKQYKVYNDLLHGWKLRG